MMIWLADVLRAAGLNVQEIDGWQTRGRGEMGDVRGILCHHTGGPMAGNAPSLTLVLNGRPDLAGPLSQLVLGRDGTFFVLAAGRCNHAGAGSWQGVTFGNSSFIGIEAENAGTPADPWPPRQMDAYIKGCAAILKHIGADAVMVAGHKEFALPKGRKIDPLFDMIEFREDVENVMAGSQPKITPPVATDPCRAMLRKGDHGEDVTVLQRALNMALADNARLAVDGVFGPVVEKAVKWAQHLHGLVEDGMVGPKTWAALGVKGG